MKTLLTATYSTNMRQKSHAAKPSLKWTQSALILHGVYEEWYVRACEMMKALIICKMFPLIFNRLLYFWLDRENRCHKQQHLQRKLFSRLFEAEHKAPFSHPPVPHKKALQM